MRIITGSLVAAGLTVASITPVHAHERDAPASAGETSDQDIVVTGRASPAPKAADDRYKPTPDASTLRSSADPSIRRKRSTSSPPRSSATSGRAIWTTS